MARAVRVSPRNLKYILDNIRGKRLADAIAILKFLQTRLLVLSRSIELCNR